MDVLLVPLSRPLLLPEPLSSSVISLFRMRPLSSSSPSPSHPLYITQAYHSAKLSSDWLGLEVQQETCGSALVRLHAMEESSLLVALASLRQRLSQVPPPSPARDSRAGSS
eukprot:768469-Hanusia_phi.AAC.8